MGGLHGRPVTRSHSAAADLLIEKTFGWLKQTGPLAQVKLRGLANVDWVFVFSCAAHHLLRLPRLIASQTQQNLQQKCA